MKDTDNAVAQGKKKKESWEEGGKHQMVWHSWWLPQANDTKGCSLIPGQSSGALVSASTLKRKGQR